MTPIDNRLIEAIICALLLCFSIFTASAAGVDNFFTPANDNGAGLPADKVYPQGRIFPFGGYSGVASREAANKFTLHGPTYGSVDTLLADAEANGLHAIYTIGIDMNFLQQNNLPVRNLTTEEITTEIKRQVAAVVDNDTIAWWYLTPEEMRYWEKAEINYLEVAANAIRESDPLGRPVWMYDPNHRDANALAKTGQFLDIIGKGIYTNLVGQKGKRVWVRWSIEQQLEAIKKSGRPGAIQIAVPEMYEDPGPAQIPTIPAWVRHDVYLALVMGAQGVVPFSLAGRDFFTPEAWGAYYNAYARIAGELNGELDLGQVFLFGERRDDLHLTINEGEPVVSPLVGHGGVTNQIDYPSVAMANIAYGSDRYLFLVNSSEANVTVRIDGFPAQPIYVRNVFTGASLPTVTSSVTVTLAPLGVVGLCFTATDMPSSQIQDTAGVSLDFIHDASGLHIYQDYLGLISPTPGMRAASQAIPVQINTPGIGLQWLKVELDGATIYEGSSLPTNLMLQTATLSGGRHTVVVTKTAPDGNKREHSIEFIVEHCRIELPKMEVGQKLSGSVPVSFAFVISPAEVKKFAITIAPIFEDKRSAAQILYDGVAAPKTWELVTTDFPDGAYDLEIVTTTASGVVSTFTHRIVIDNWTTLEDAILPPTNNWFATVDNLKSIERSAGWEYPTNASDAYFGDAERIQPQSMAEEYIVWQLPRLQQFSFTVYSRSASITQHVTIAISADGLKWQDISYETTVIRQSNNDVMQLQLTGSLPTSLEGQYIRFTVAGGNSDADIIELGHVLLNGIK